MSCQSNESITIGYQGMANPWKLLIQNKSFEKITDKTLQWKKFDSGAKVINAMASGDVDLAAMGSTPLATAVGKDLSLQVIWVLGIIGESEAFVTKPGIESFQDLKGKKIAVPFGSTCHYHLLVALEKNDIKVKDVEIYNLTPSSIVSSWKNDQVDAAFVWAPVLEEIKKTGKVLISSKDLAEKGDPTFDAFVGRKEFLKNNREFTALFLKEINQLHKKVRSEKWTETSQEVKEIASFIGSNPLDVYLALSGYQYPLREDQIGADLLGGGLHQALKKTSEFLKDQGKISEVKQSFDSFVTDEYAKASE